MAEGNFGDTQGVGDGVIERRVHFGPGYRVYFAWEGPTLTILLGGGDKNAQPDDIARARGELGNSGETTESGKRAEVTMPLSEDWKIAEPRALKRDQEYFALTVEGVRELLGTGDDEDQLVARGIARGLLELEFETDAELLELLKRPVSA